MARGIGGYLASSSKEILARIGRYVPISYVKWSQPAINYLVHGRWMYERGFDSGERLRTREQVWDAMGKRICNERVLYLEFGVAHGGSIEYWANILKNPKSVLHGFDSFEGLPEAGGRWAQGEFDVDGLIPVSEDHRIQFFKGWFNEVLPSYTVPPHDILVINLDADLYSSTIYVLRYLRPYIQKGTFLYFDELHYTDQEQRAFDDFAAETGLKFRCCAADRCLAHVFFECLG